MIIGGLLLLAWSLSRQAGGMGAVLAVQSPGFFRILPPPNASAVLEYIAAWITIGLGSIPQQDVFQRVMAARSEKAAISSGILAGCMYLTFGMVPLFIGLCAAFLYPNMELSDNQMIIPGIVLQHGSPFLQVLFFGALLSAILSTTSGAMLAPATVLGENIIRPMLRQQTDRLMLLTMRLSVIGVATCAAVLATGKSNIYELVGLSSALSLVSLFCPLTAGLFWKGCSRAGAMAGMAGGMIAWIASEFAFPSEIPGILLGGMVSLLCLIAGSLLFPDNSHDAFVRATS